MATPTPPVTGVELESSPGRGIRRETRISDGELLLTTDVRWVETVKITNRITREVPIHVTMQITATESTGQTVLRGVATGEAGTEEFRCGVIRGIAERRAAAELNTGLARAISAIESGGRRYYASGSADIAGVLRDSIGIGRARP